MHLSFWTRTPSKPAAFTAGLVSVLVIGLFDYLTGYEMSMFIFYAAPILAVAWFVDQKSAILLALIAGVIWWWADRLALHPYRWGWLQAWETLVRIGLFLFSAVSGAVIRAYYESTKARILLLEHSQQLEQQIINISEEQQRRIGRDLHDGICQHLAALGYSASSLEKDLDRAGHGEWASNARDLAKRLRQSVVQTRDLARGLSPVQIETDGLASALEELAATAKHLLGTDCVFDGETQTEVYDQSTATHLYRIAQEAINNATRHGKATHISLTLTANPEMVELLVRDNGTGFDRQLVDSGGMGLKIMAYRARCLGGQIELKTTPAEGTMVCCKVPQPVFA